MCAFYDRTTGWPLSWLHHLTCSDVLQSDSPKAGLYCEQSKVVKPRHWISAVLALVQLSYWRTGCSTWGKSHWSCAFSFPNFSQCHLVVKSCPSGYEFWMHHAFNIPKNCEHYFASRCCRLEFFWCWWPFVTSLSINNFHLLMHVDQRHVFCSWELITALSFICTDILHTLLYLETQFRAF